jgi:hypothetical protein
VICLLALMSLTATAAAEPSPSPFTIRLEGTQNAEQFPVLLIHVGAGGREPQPIRVRFPEIIQARVPGKDQPLKLYQDNRSPEWPVVLDCQPIDRPVTWKGSGASLGYEMRFDNGMLLQARARIERGSVTLGYSLENRTDLHLLDLCIWNCIQLLPHDELNDPLMERTFVQVDDTFKSMRALVPDFEPYAPAKAAQQRFLAFLPTTPRPFEDNPFIAPHPGHPDDPELAISFWQVAPPIDATIIATTSRDKTWTLVTRASGAPGVWTNPGISCHHADPILPRCGAGETGTVTATVHFVEGEAHNPVLRPH